MNMTAEERAQEQFFKHLMKEHASRNVPLTYDEAYQLGQYALKGFKGKERVHQWAQIQSFAALCALHNRATYGWHRPSVYARSGHCMPETAAEQIAGVCAAIFDHDIRPSSAGFLKPNVPYAMDNCGMGGDFIVTANVSTLAALIAASGGLHICKHGSPANADRGRHGSSDFIEEGLGLNKMASKSLVEQCVETHGFGYTEALDSQYKKLHRQTHEVVPMPHMNDLIGPITNPLLPELLQRRVLGVNHLVSPRLVAEAYQIMNAHGVTNLQHGLFVRGQTDGSDFGGMDEISICAGGTEVAELKGTTITEYRWHARDFGLSEALPVAISPPDGITKGVFSKQILTGIVGGPPLDMVCANAAPLFYLAGRSDDLAECAKMARTLHDDGADRAKADALRAMVGR